MSRSETDKSEKFRPIDTLWLFNIAMENDSFIDGLPIKNGDFPWLNVINKPEAIRIFDV